MDFDKLLALSTIVTKIRSVFADKAGTAIIDLHDDKHGAKTDHQLVFRAEIVPRGARPAWLDTAD